MLYKSVKEIVLGMFVIAGLTFCAYSFMLSSPYKTMDDEVSIIKNQRIHSLAHIPEIFTTPYFDQDAYYRPLPMFSYALEYHFFKLNPLYYYLTNIFIHIAMAWAVFALLLTILPSARLAFPIAVLFAIHPVHWEAVSNISGRAILLCALFEVVTLWLFSLADKKEDRLLYLLSLGAFSLALLSKESAGVLPLVIFSYLLFVSRDKSCRFREKVAFLVPFFILEAIYIGFRVYLGMTGVYHWQNGTQMALGVLSFLRGLLSYIRIMIFPVDLHFDRSRAVFTSFVDVQAVLTIVTFGIIIFLFCRWWRVIPAIVKFFLAWFLIDLFPVSQVFASIGVQPGRISLAEHFLYTPTVGFLAIMALLTVWILERAKRIISPVAARVVVSGIYIFFFLTTVQNTIYASNEIAMFERTMHFEPENIRIRNSLALAYAKAREFDKAELNFRKTLEIDPANARARIGLGKALVDLGSPWAGLLEYEKVRDPGDLDAILEKNRQAVYQLLLAKYSQAIDNSAQKARAYFSRGVVYSKMGKTDLAIKDYENAVLADPNDQNALFNLASSYDALNDIPRAQEYYEKFLDLSTSRDHLHAAAYQQLKLIYEKVGDKNRINKYTNY